MMSRKFFLSVILAGIAMAGWAPPTQAAFAITVYVDGTNQNVTTLGTANNFGLGFGISVTDFSNIQVGSLTNFPGTNPNANESNTTNGQVTTAFGTSGGTHTITFVISESNWSAPTSIALGLSTTGGGSIGGGLGGTINATNQGFLTPNDILVDTSATPGGAPTPKQTASALSPLTGTNSLVYTPTPATSVVPGGTPFTMTEVISYTFTVAAGSGQITGDFSGSVNASPVPAPAGILLAITGLPVGIGTWLRRRRQVRLTAV